VTVTPNLCQLLHLVDQQRSVDDLRAYFGTDLPPGTPPRYTGGRFELLAGGGDRPEVTNRITTEDLFAIQLLEVRVPTEVGLELLEGELGRAVAEHLARIPTDVGIGDLAAAALLADGAPADLAWRLLEDPDGMGWVTVNKLLARKRPALIPVYDRVVSCAFGAPRGFWSWLQPLFAEQNGLLAGRLQAQRDAAEVPAEVTPLRVLDVIVWMRHEQEHRASRCPGLSWDAPGC
jgi:hypothetical protein